MKTMMDAVSIKSAIKYVLIISVFVLLLLILGLKWKNILFHVYLNLGSYQVVDQFLPYSNVCQNELPVLPDRYLEAAYELNQGRGKNWNVLVLAKGFTDRRWLSQHSMVEGIYPSVTLYSKEFMSESLRKDFVVRSEQWTCRRSILAWSAWNYGLINSSQQQWEQAVSNYQAGIGLTPGRVPEDIIKEYYFSLSNYLLSQDDHLEHNTFQAAKYSALSGDLETALSLLEEFAQSVDTDAAGFDEYTIWHNWITAALNSDPTALDINHYMSTIEKKDSHFLNEKIPEWEVTQTTSLSRPSVEGFELIGFDLDQDILSAGVELLGVLYWRTPDNQVTMKPFRQPNLWTNAGSMWLPHEYWYCLPGYFEPDWIEGCASQKETLPDDEGNPITVSSLMNPVENAPDYYVETPSSAIEPGTDYVYGGEWWVDGDFPNPYIARRYLSEENPGRIEVVLELGSIPQRTWQQAVSLVSPADSPSESVIWVRPKSGSGTGELRFQNAFSFKLPNP